MPYADGRALEDHYVELIDAAAETIDIVNPYLNLTPKLAGAFGRALDRGVKVTIVTRIDLKDDIGGEFLTALNEMFVEQYAGRIAMYEYQAPEVVLHAKILMIDGRYVSVSSVNLNNRSFIQDSENGIAVLDRAFYKRMRAVFDSYVARSQPDRPRRRGAARSTGCCFQPSTSTKRSESGPVFPSGSACQPSRLTSGKGGLISGRNPGGTPSSNRLKIHKLLQLNAKYAFIE